MLGFGTFRGISIGLPKPCVNGLPQVFFRLEYSCGGLINEPLCLFLDPIVDYRTSYIGKEGHSPSIRVSHDVCIWVHSSVNLESEHESFASFLVTCKFEGRIYF